MLCKIYCFCWKSYFCGFWIRFRIIQYQLIKLTFCNVHISESEKHNLIILVKWHYNRLTQSPWQRLYTVNYNIQGGQKSDRLLAFKFFICNFCLLTYCLLSSLNDVVLHLPVYIGLNKFCFMLILIASQWLD